MATQGLVRERLLVAAEELIADAGVRAVSHRSVEERAGVARGSLRYYFQSRDELLAAVIEHMAAADRAVLERAAEAVEGASVDPGVMDAATQASALQSMAADFLRDPRRDLARFEMFVYAAHHPELKPVIAEWRDTFVELSAAHLTASGAAHPHAMARLTVAAMDGMILHALTAPHPDYLRYGPAWLAELADVGARFTLPEPGDHPAGVGSAGADGPTTRASGSGAGRGKPRVEQGEPVD